MSLLDTASLIVTPNGYKEGKLYSVIPSDGSGDLSVTRATTATRVNSAGLVELVPYNIFQYSQEFNTAPWGTQQDATITANATTAPNGTATADLIYPAATNVIVAAVQSYSSVGSQQYTQSIYVKAAGKNFAALYTMNGQTGTAMWVNLTTGAITNGVGGNVTNRFAESIGNGWWRIGFSDLGNGSINYMHIYPTDSAGSITATANGTDGIYIWGAQLVEGSTAKDYQKTETRLNIPRLDYSNGTCPSLLVEPQRTNSCLYSEDISNAVWTKDGLSLTANAIASPSGVQNADLLNETTANSQHRIYQNAVSTISGQPITFSAYAKYSGRQYIYLRVDDSSGNKIAFFDVQNGLVSTLSSGVTATIEDAGNGWYRCIMSVPSVTGSATAEGLIGLANSTTFPSIYAGNTSIGVYLWGIQIETNSTYPTSYIPTTSASVTRNADVISKTGISSLIGQTEGVWYLDLYASAQNIDGGAFATWLVAGDSSNNLQIYNIGTTLYWYAKNTGGVLIDQTANQTLVEGERYKIAFAYKSGEYALYINGVQKRTNTNANVPAVSQFNLSAAGYGASPVMVKNEYNAVALWKTRLTNDQLATLTTL